MPIQFIDSKCHIKKWKSRKTALFNYYTWLSHNLLLMLSGAGTHTHTPTFADEMISRNQAHAGRRPVRVWFKKLVPLKFLAQFSTIFKNKILKWVMKKISKLFTLENFWLYSSTWADIMLKAQGHTYHANHKCTHYNCKVLLPPLP